MKYRTKPFEIEAIQWTGENAEEIKTFVGQNTYNGQDDFLLPNEITGVWLNAHVWDYLQKTWVPVNINDYIIKGMKGEFYPCDPEVFESKYEPVFAIGGRIESSYGYVPDNGFVIPRKKLTNDNEE